VRARRACRLAPDSLEQRPFLVSDWLKAHNAGAAPTVWFGERHRLPFRGNACSDLSSTVCKEARLFKRLCRPRFTLRALLLFVTGCALLLGAWIRWPHWTAERFLALVAQGRFEEADAMLEIDPVGASWRPWPVADVTYEHRNLEDRLVGRMRFRIDSRITSRRGGFVNSRIFVVERGRITLVPLWNDYVSHTSFPPSPFPGIRPGRKRPLTR
jgi:hypothetical protein